MWRSTGDIGAVFAGSDRGRAGAWKPRTVLENLDSNAGCAAMPDRGHWNDPDMLEVGNGMSVNQDRAHFTMWCMMAAPLILGNDLRAMPQETAAILLNQGGGCHRPGSAGCAGASLRNG